MKNKLSYQWSTSINKHEFPCNHKVWPEKLRSSHPSFLPSEICLGRRKKQKARQECAAHCGFVVVCSGGECIPYHTGSAVVYSIWALFGNTVQGEWLDWSGGDGGRKERRVQKHIANNLCVANIHPTPTLEYSGTCFYCLYIIPE